MKSFGIAVAFAFAMLTNTASAKSCSDDAVEKVTSYNHGSSTNIFSPVLRLEFKRDHTLVALQGFDGEFCAILPPRADLIRRKVNLGWLQPGIHLGLEGSQHKSEDGRVWAVGIRHDGVADYTQIR